MSQLASSLGIPAHPPVKGVVGTGFSEENQC